MTPIEDKAQKTGIKRENCLRFRPAAFLYLYKYNVKKVAF